MAEEKSGRVSGWQFIVLMSHPLDNDVFIQVLMCFVFIETPAGTKTAKHVNPNRSGRTGVIH